MRFKNLIIAVFVGIFYKDWCLTVNELNLPIIIGTLMAMVICFIALNGLDEWWKEYVDER